MIKYTTSAKFTKKLDQCCCQIQLISWWCFECSERHVIPPQIIGIGRVGEGGGEQRVCCPPLSRNNPATVKKVDHKCTKLKGKMIISVHFILFEHIGKKFSFQFYFYTSALQKWGVYWFTFVRGSVRPSVRPSFRNSVTLFCQRYLHNRLR